MGLFIFTKKLKYRIGNFEEFAALKNRIAKNLDKEFGEHYLTIAECLTKNDFVYFENTCKEIIDRKKLDIDIINFILSSSSEGKLKPKTCKKIYNIIKDDYRPLFLEKNQLEIIYLENFKKFLLMGYKKKRKEK